MPDRASIHARLLTLPCFSRDGGDPAATGARRVACPDAGDVARRLAVLGARVVLASESGYPNCLRDLADPPAAVFVRGELPARSRAVAVVGSRAASGYGIEQAGRLAADLARLGYAIVSGLARGIDAAAHRGALEAGGRSVAVLPGGLDAVTPRHHRELAERVAERGALVTEIAAGEPVARAMFVRRNRLIAAFSSATVVVEAAERSGALRTAEAARRIGRPVLAVPGDVDRETSRGCHALIRGGAGLCEGAGDVVRALGFSGPADPQAGAEARLVAALSERPEAAERLARAAALTLDEALAALLCLEWAGLACARPGQRWVRAARRVT
jgi:DNA processing protein